MGGSRVRPTLLGRVLSPVRNWLSDRQPSELVAMLGLAGLGAVAASLVLAHFTDDEWRDALWLEVAKAGVWVVAVGVLGGALSSIWQRVTADREAEAAEATKEHDRELALREKERDRELAEEGKARDRELERKEKIREELASLVEMYNAVKSVRRTLRSLGFDRRFPSPREDSGQAGDVLTAEQARGFHAQMLVLNGLQLDFESKAKLFGQAGILGDDAKQVVQLLGHVEGYLNDILRIWEMGGWTIRQGTHLAVVSDGLIRLFRVRASFRPGIANPLHEITQLMNKQLFGEANADARTALDVIIQAQADRDEGEGADGKIGDALE
jgi:hypothetical protein